MVPGFTDTECRIVEFRYQELLAEADRQRRAASAAHVPADQVRVMETIQHGIGAIRQQFRYLLAGVRTHEATNPAGTHSTAAVK